MTIRAETVPVAAIAALVLAPVPGVAHCAGPDTTISDECHRMAAAAEGQRIPATAGRSASETAPPAAPTPPVVIALGNGATMTIGGGAAGFGDENWDPCSKERKARNAR